MHILTCGSLEEHPENVQMPDHLLGEEQRLRLLEKKRAAGELRKPQKSAVSRSTEVIARRLSQPREEVDVAAELRKADTQAELCRAQRRLADASRRAETADTKAGLGPKLLNIPRWVQEEAEQQKANLAAGKTKDGKEKGKVTVGAAAPSYVWTGGGGTDGGNPIFVAGPPVQTSASSGAMAEDGLLVECRGCSSSRPWAALDAGDGFCTACLQSPTLEPSGAAEVPTDGTAVAPAAGVVGELGDCTVSATACIGEAPGGGGPAPPPPRQSTWRARRQVQRRAASDV
mmetsp:Transcript_171531/g.544875  ORF Transcript_171531/g.544875 Transcript_171531/m.544875 type:complete len:287 (-) Transcript_171531:71-931(-)